jgi:hypothetical protein
VEEKPLACTLLIGVKSSDLSGPLTLFQDTKPTHDDLLKLVKTLNKALGNDALNEAQLEGIFDIVWPKLEERLNSLPSDGPAQRPHRSEREMLEELVDLQRSKSASDAQLLAKAEESVLELRAQLSSAEASLALERARLAEMQFVSASAADRDMWALLGRNLTSGEPGERAVAAHNEARANPRSTKASRLMEQVKATLSKELAREKTPEAE